MRNAVPVAGFAMKTGEALLVTATHRTVKPEEKEQLRVVRQGLAHVRPAGRPCRTPRSPRALMHEPWDRSLTAVPTCDDAGLEPPQIGQVWSQFRRSCDDPIRLTRDCPCSVRAVKPVPLLRLGRLTQRHAEPSTHSARLAGTSLHCIGRGLPAR